MNDFLEAQSERSWEKLQELSIEDLITRHDLLSNRSGLGPEYYREEIRYRRQLKLAEQMEGITRKMANYTKVITVLTVVILGATLYNVFVG